MAIPITGTTAKLATVVLLLTITSGGLHSSASRVVVTPQSSSSSSEKNTVVGDDAPTNHHVRYTYLTSPAVETPSPPGGLAMVPKRGTGVVMITPRAAAASSINGTSSSVQDYCDDSCNNDNCRYYHPGLCQPKDLDHCYVGCHCADMLCHCICSR